MTVEKVGATENILISDAEWRERLLAAPLGNANPAVVRAVAGGNPESLMPSMLKSIEDKIGLKWHRGFVNVNAYDTLKAENEHLREGYRLILSSGCCPSDSHHGNTCPRWIAEEALSKAKLSVDGEGK